jgi:hypothetical protein
VFKISFAVEHECDEWRILDISENIGFKSVLIDSSCLCCYTRY